MGFSNFWRKYPVSIGKMTNRGWVLKIMEDDGCFLWGGVSDYLDKKLLRSINYGIQGKQLHYMDTTCVIPENLSLNEKEDG